MGLFSSKAKSKTSSWTAPMTQTMPGITGAIGDITNWMRTPQQFYPEQTYAGATPEQLQAIEQMKAAAGTAGEMVSGMGAGYQAALGRPEAVLGQGLQNVAANPYLAGVADVMERRSEERMLEDILPQMEASAVGRGGLGGSRLGIQAQQAERDRQRSLDEALAGLYGQAWSEGLGAETSRYNQALAGTTAALGQTPTMLSALQTPAQQLFGAGGLERAEEQRAIDEQMKRFQFEQMEPFQRASMGLGQLMVPGQAFQRGETTTTSKSTPSTFSNIGSMLGAVGAIGGGLGGMGIFGGGGGVPMGTPYGGYGSFSPLPQGWGVSPTYGMADPWGGAATYNMWG